MCSGTFEIRRSFEISSEMEDRLATAEIKEMIPSSATSATSVCTMTAPTIPELVFTGKMTRDFHDPVGKFADTSG